MVHIAKCQLKRIQEATEKIIRYLVHALLEPSLETTMGPDTHITGEANYFYVMATIWYAIKNFPNWNWEWKTSVGNLALRDYRLFERTYLPPGNWTFGRGDRDKVPLLQWYHFGSILKLCEKGFLPQCWNEDHLRQKVSGLEKAAKLAAAEKLSSQRPYTADDEIIDRLAFLSDEMGLERTKSTPISTVAKLAMSRVKQREFTRELNPGWHACREECATSGPWEIHALCHHSRLVVLTLERKEAEEWRMTGHAKAEMECYKQKVCGFLNGEGTLVPCWERAHLKARKGWLRSEASAVFATTILGADGNSMLSPALNGISSDAAIGAMYMAEMMKDQLDVFEKSTGEIGRARPIPWKSFCAPRQYHPESFTNSLEDTPELYKAPRIKDTFIPISLQNDVNSPEDKDLKFTKSNFTEAILKDLSVSDIRADEGSEQDDNDIAWKVRHLYFETLDEKEKEQKGSLLSWALYDSLVDQEVQHRFLYDDHRPAIEQIGLLIRVIVL